MEFAAVVGVGTLVYTFVYFLKAVLAHDTTASGDGQRPPALIDLRAGERVSD